MTTTPQDDAASTAGYDPEQDTDSDPANLNPRTGAAAKGGSEDDGDDPDGDPANLNPRDDSAESESSDA